PSDAVILLPYGSQKPVVGDKVLIGQVPQDDGSRSWLILGEIAAPLSASGLAIPVGVIWTYGGSSAPTGWPVCDGSAVSRTTYADLFGVISTTYGAGDGSTTFNVPNMAGRSPIGVGDSGTAGHTNHALGTAGGEESHNLTTAELAAHHHAGPSHTHT